MRMILSVMAIILLIVPAIAPGADFTGDGIDDIAVFRPSSGLWAVRGFTRVYFGTWNDEPVPGNYNGALGDEFAIYRATSGLWAIRGVTRAYYGSGGDIPISDGGDADWYRSGTNLCALAAGNIGIGTGNPQEKLHINGRNIVPNIRLERSNYGDYWDIGGKTGAFLNFDYIGTGGMVTFDGVNSRVGIRTSSPDYTLDAIGDRVRLRRSTQTTAKTIAMRLDGAAGIADIDADNADLFLKSNSGNTMIQPFGGNVGIGVTNPSYTVDINGPVMLRGQSGPPITGNPWAGIFAKPTGNTELWCIDGIGQTTQLSPHDPETGEWIFYSKNKKTGRVVRVDMERMVRYLDELTGEDFLREWNEPVEMGGVKSSALRKSPETGPTARTETATIPSILERIRTLKDKIAALEAQDK